MVHLVKKVIEEVCRRHALMERVQRGMHARAETAKVVPACPSRGTNDRHGTFVVIGVILGNLRLFVAAILASDGWLSGVQRSFTLKHVFFSFAGSREQEYTNAR